MTEDGEKALLREYCGTCERLSKGFRETASLIAPLMPIGPDRIDALELGDETLVLAYLKRFEQFEDALHRTLKAISKVMEHGRIERLTSVDVTRRAHGLGILESEKIWADAVRTRNALAHEYPLNPAKRAEQIAAAWNSRKTLDHTWSAIIRFIDEERLLDD
ncbi:conserved hypothetical protein [Sphingomonas sp. EC-HK361]|nr:conserved hypothetical protein [Sphingomonas sp. EC-HK361]